ncbi:MAG: hypothetical protein ACTS22_02275 [Phycisphaerales bacterium]
MSAATPALPLWAIVPPAAVLMLVLAASVKAMQTADMPASRRRIRTSAAMIMLVLQPLLVYLFGIGTAQTPRPFIFTWALVIGLLGILVILAGLDMLNNTRIAAQKRAALRMELRRLREELTKHAGRHGSDTPSPSLRLTDPEPDAPERERGP